MTIAIILLAVLCLAYANGSNDNFKGVATLFGSGTTNYRWALVWATITTLLGSLAAVFLAEQLLKSFSGKGLVSSSLVAEPNYAAAVALGAGALRDRYSEKDRKRPSKVNSGFSPYPP